MNKRYNFKSGQVVYLNKNKVTVRADYVQVTGNTFILVSSDDELFQEQNTPGSPLICRCVKAYMLHRASEFNIGDRVISDGSFVGVITAFEKESGRYICKSINCHDRCRYAYAIDEIHKDTIIKLEHNLIISDDILCEYPIKFMYDEILGSYTALILKEKSFISLNVPFRNVCSYGELKKYLHPCSYNK